MDLASHHRLPFSESCLQQWQVRKCRRGRHSVTVHAKQKKQKQQYGPAAGGAVDLSPQLEAAYQQFGRALGEAPGETARIVQAKLGQEQQQAARRSAPQAAASQSRSPKQRQLDEASHEKLEKLFDMAMSDPQNDQEAQPRALIRAKNKMGSGITEEQRRQTLWELMESTLATRKAAVSLEMDLIEPVRPAMRQQIPELQMPLGKPEAPAAAGPQSSLGAPAAAPTPIPDLVMPRGKQLSPSAGVTAPKAPSAQPAAPRTDPGPPPPLTQPKGRLKVNQAARLAQELDALQQGAPNTTAATPAPAIQAPKPVPAVQPVPELSQAPARPRPQLLQEDVKPAQTEAADSSDSTSDIRASNTPSEAPPQTVPEPPPQLKQAPLRPGAATAQVSPEIDSSAAAAEEHPSPDTSQRLKQPRATASAAQEGPPLLEETSAQPTLERSRSAPSSEEGIGIAAGLDVQPSSHAAAEPLPQLKGAPVRPTARLSRTVQPGERTAGISAGPDQQELAKPRPQAEVEAASPQLAPAIEARTSAERVAPEASEQAEVARAASDAPAAAPATESFKADWKLRADTAKAQEPRSAAAGEATESRPPPQRPLRPKSQAAPDAAAQQPSFGQEAGDSADASTATSDAPPSGAPRHDRAPAGASASKPVSAVEAVQQNGTEVAAQLAPAPPRDPLPKLAKPAAQQARGAKDNMFPGAGMLAEELFRLAEEARDSMQLLPGTAISASFGGVVVALDNGVRGFLPFSQMALEKQQAASRAYEQLGLPEDTDVDRAREAFRRVLDNLFLFTRFQVYVTSCKLTKLPEARGPGRIWKLACRSTMSEVPKVDWTTLRVRAPSPEACEVLMVFLGKTISGEVNFVTEQFAILHFDVDLGSGASETVRGMLSSRAADLSNVVVGQTMEVVLHSVCSDRRGLKLYGTDPKFWRLGGSGPLQQTLEDLAAELNNSEGTLGMLPEVELLCQALMQQEGVSFTMPGRRLQGTAFATEIQVFLSKSDDGEGAGEGELRQYTVLARAGNEVQEVEVQASLNREQMKSTLSVALSSVIQAAQ